MQREKHLLEFMSNASKMNTSSKYLDPFDRKLRPLQLVVSNWTACSATCGRGVRQRNVTCEIITDNYFEIFSLKVCQNAGLEVPDTTEKCNLKPCTKWIAKDWSPVRFFSIALYPWIPLKMFISNVSYIFFI